MFKKIQSLIWLRTQILTSNKNALIQVLMPLGFVLLFDKFMNPNGDQGKFLLYVCLNMGFSFSAGTLISSSISEEKEKNTYKTLLLSGITRLEYLSSILFYPIMYVLAIVFTFPKLLDVSFGKEYLTYFIVACLVALCMILINLFVGAISETQTQAQIYGMIPMLIVSFLPMLAQSSMKIKELMDYTFLGIYVDFFTKPDFQLNFDSVKVSIVWIVSLFFLSVLSLNKISFWKNIKFNPVFKKV